MSPAQSQGQTASADAVDVAGTRGGGGGGPADSPLGVGAQRLEQVLPNACDLALGKGPDGQRMQPPGQCLGGGRQGILPGRAGDHGGPGEAALTVQPGLERIQDVGHPLVLVDANRGRAAGHR